MHYILTRVQTQKLLFLWQITELFKLKQGHTQGTTRARALPIRLGALGHRARNMAKSDLKALEGLFGSPKGCLTASLGGGKGAQVG